MSRIQGELAFRRGAAALPTPSAWRCLWAALLATVLAGCGSIGPVGTSREVYVPPPPLSIVAIVDPSGDQVAAESAALVAVVRASVTASETIVVSSLSGVPLAATYVVQRGDSLNSIAAARGLSLAALEASNPQLGPLARRDWNRIYAGDRVTIPGRAAPGQRSPEGNLVVTRAPKGPAPPTLVRLPQRPRNATSFQDAQYRRALAGARSINRERVAAWQAAVARALLPWQAKVITQLQGIATGGQGVGTPDLSASIQAAATTLGGLAGRRVLLLLGPGPSGPPAAAMPRGSLAGLHLVVANLADPNAAAAWTSWARAAGAAPTVLDPALTQLQLASAVNG